MPRKNKKTTAVVVYTSHRVHTVATTSRNWNQPYLQLVIVDPGKKNYALRIERRYDDGRVDTLAMANESIGTITKHEPGATNTLMAGVMSFLDRFSLFYPDCHALIIEKQITPNVLTIHSIAQYTVAYFALRLANTPLLPAIIELDSTLKTRQLGCPRGIDIKKWAVETSLQLLTNRGDEFGLSTLSRHKKQDDIADTIIMGEAFVSWLSAAGLKLVDL
jgi:hypothetical protein